MSTAAPIRPQDPAALFDAIPLAQRAEWRSGKVSLDQICPRVKHETSAVRNEILRRLQNWSVQG